MPSEPTHRLQPNTKYRIVHIDLAIPVDSNADDHALADSLNEIVWPAMLAGSSVFHDYQIRLATGVIRQTGDAPSEGELFDQDTLDTAPRVYQLHDVQDQIDESKPQAAPLSVTVDAGGDFIAFNIAGCGLRDMDGDGRVVLLENCRGKPILMVWADINDANTTDEIDLSGALESERIKD